MAYVSEFFLDISAFCCAVTRSSPLTSALFGYACLLTMAPLVGTPRLAGDSLRLFLDSWMLARGPPPTTSAAVDHLLMTYGGSAAMCGCCAPCIGMPAGPQRALLGPRALGAGAGRFGAVRPSAGRVSRVDW